MMLIKGRPKLEKIEGVKNPPTVSEMVMSFLYAAIFGVACLAPWMELKDLIPLLFRALGGYKYAYNAVYIGSTIVLGVAWLVLFMVLWNRLERDFDYKRCLIKALIWTAIALAVFGLAALGHAILDTTLLKNAVEPAATAAVAAVVG